MGKAILLELQSAGIRFVPRERCWDPKSGRRWLIRGKQRTSRPDGNPM